MSHGPAQPDEPGATAPARPASNRALARNTLIFSIATGLSRIAGLIREIVARRYFGTEGPASAFTLAFQIPNLVRAFVADSALSAAFVPVFTGLLDEGRKKEAMQLASTLLMVLIAALGALTIVSILAAGVVVPLFTGASFDEHLDDLAVGLTQVLFPIVLLLGINGLLVGILNAHDHFSVPAIAPLVWNGVIIASLVGLRPLFSGDGQLYAYAIGVLLGTVVQLVMTFPVLKRLGITFTFDVDLHDPRIRQVFLLMLPVTLALGIINVNLLITSSLGTLISDEASTGIDAAFRIYMLPQGMFSVAVATVLFPALSRFATRKDFDGLRDVLGSGLRQIILLLVPAAVFTAVLATPIVRLIYQRGVFDEDSTRLVSEALFWFSFSLPASGINLLMTRTFFSLQQAWSPTKLSFVNVGLNAVVSLALYKPLGVSGLVIGTVVGSIGMTIGQAIVLRRLLDGRLDGARILAATLRIAAASALLGVVAYGVWWGLDQGLGRSLPGQIASVGVAAALGSAVYAAAVIALRVPEARQVQALIAGRVVRGR